MNDQLTKDALERLGLSVATSVPSKNPDINKGVQHIGSLAAERVKELKEMMKNPALYAPISTDIPDLDEILGGVTFPSYLAIGGRKKIGKTVVATHLARVIAASKRTVILKKPTARALTSRVVAFHLEETRWQYTDRIMVSLADSVTRTKIRDLKLTAEHFEELHKVSAILDFSELYVEDEVFDADRMIAIAMEMNAPFIVVDTFNLVRSMSPSQGAKKLEEISAKFLYARNTLNLSTIMIHHKNREDEDLGTDALGRDADVRITVSQPEDVVNKGSAEGVLRLDVERSRNSGTGTVDVLASYSANRIMPMKANKINFTKMTEELEGEA